MRKKFLLFTIFFCLFWIIVLKNSNQSQLQTEVKQILKILLPSESEMQHNAFVGLLAVTAPKETNPQKLGEDLVLAYIKLYSQALKKQDYKLAYHRSIDWSKYLGDKKLLTSSFRYPCLSRSLAEVDCIAKIRQEKKKYIKLINENKIIFNRYKKYILLPNYDSYTDNLSFIPSSDMINLSNLHLIEAIYAIDEGRIDEGLDTLQTELNFYKRSIVNTQQFDNLQLIVFTTRLKTIYQTISTLIDEPIMQEYLNNTKIESLLKSFSNDEQRVLVSVLKTVRSKNIQFMYFDANQYDKDEIIKFSRNMISNFDELRWYRKFFWKYDAIKTMNLYYRSMEHYIVSANLILPDSSEYYRKKIKPLLSKEPMTISEIEETNNDNIVGHLLVKQLERQSINNNLRLYDTISYLRLVQVKLQIKRSNITEENIPVFLKKLGEKALNPYSKQPINWDRKTQTLSYDWLNTEEHQDNPKALVQLGL